MICKVLQAQKENTSPGDFSELVEKDKEVLGLQLSDNDISKMTKPTFRKVIKSKTKEAAFTYLKSIKEGHSKMDGLRYDALEKAAYLSSPIFDSESRRLLLALRTRTVNGIKNDFRGAFVDIKCPLKCGEDDTLQHLLECNVIKIHHKSSDIAHSDIKYQDVFSEDVVKQKQVTELYQQLLKTRTILLESEPVVTTGPVHCN